MRPLKKYLWQGPRAFVAIEYAWQGVLALIGSAEHRAIIHVLGFSDSLSATLGYLVAPLDIGVAILLIYRPNRWLFMWAILWPWVPRMMELYGGLNVEFGESLVLSLAAALAYVISKRHGKQTK